METPPEHVVFGSYNSRDRPKVQSIARDLETWGIHLWLDIHLKPGKVFGSAIEAVIDRADAAVVFIGAERGPWQELEIFMLLQKQLSKKLSVLIPVLLEGAGPNAGGFLSNIEHVDFRRDGLEPLKQLAGALLDSAAPGSEAQEVSNRKLQAIVEWVLAGIAESQELLSLTDKYIEASLWPEAILACKRLRSIALDNHDTLLFAQSCERLGEIYLLTGQETLADGQWAVSRAIRRRFAIDGTTDIENRMNELHQRARSSSGKTHPASLQL